MIGCGGVGLQVVAAARLAGADPIVAVDRDARQARVAHRRGATHFSTPTIEEVVGQVAELTGGGADHAIEVVGRPETMRLAWDAIRPGGTVVVVGLAPAGVEVSLPAIEFLSDKGIRGSYYGSGDPAVDLPALAALALDGRIDLAGVVTNVSVLDGVNDALDRLRHGAGARTILVLDESAAGISARPA